MKTEKFKKATALLLILSMLLTGFGITDLPNSAYAAEESVNVSVRIEDEAETVLPYTELDVERFDIAPFITGDPGAFAEPKQIVSAHALIEAIYYANYGTDPELDDLTLSEELTTETIDTIKSDLSISNGSWGLGIDNINGNDKLVMSAINNVGGLGIGSDELSSGDEIVFYPWADSSFNSLNYSYFSDLNVKAVQNAPVELTLQNIVTDPDTWASSVLPAAGATIYIDGESSDYTTDAAGKVSLQFDSPGEYIVSAMGSDSGAITRPYCKVTVVEGIGLNELTISTPNSWGYEDTLNVLPLMDEDNSYEMQVANSVATCSALAVPSEEDAAMSAVYAGADADEPQETELTSGKAATFNLEVGINTLELKVQNGSDIKTYHLTIKREPALEALNISIDGTAYNEENIAGSATTKLNIADSAVTGLSVAAVQANDNQTVSVQYKTGNGAFSEAVALTDNTSQLLSGSIAAGNNTFEFTVTENGVSRKYVLIISLLGSEPADESASSVIDSISQSDIAYDSDWIIGMTAAGKASLISKSDKEDFLASVLIEARKDSVNIGKLSKMIIALTAMGIDPSQVPDADGLPMDLIEKLSTASTIDGLGAYGIYTAPYILLSYDSGDFSVDEDAPLSREKVVSYILANQSSGSWSSDVDLTGMVLTALSNETSFDGVSEAIESSVTWLSSQQGADGSFSSWGTKNANSAACTVIALSALGIDADGDERFIKNDVSALEDLLSYRTADNRFGYNDNTYNAMATQQGFQALAAYTNLKSGENGNIFIFEGPVSLYEKWPDSKILTDIIITDYPEKIEKGQAIDPADLEVKARFKTESTQELITLSSGDYTFEPASFDTTGAHTVKISYAGKTVSFITTVVESGSSSEDDATIQITVKGAGGKALIRVSDFVIVEDETTPMDALRSVLGKAGYSVETNAAGTYVESIEGLGEFDLGKNSGWLYSVNGKTPPTTGATEYKLKDGDAVVWYFTEDYTSDSSSSSWVADTKIKSSYEVSLGKGGDEATFIFDADALESISDSASGDVSINASVIDSADLSEKLSAEIGGRPVYEFTVTVGSKRISDFDGTVTAKIPYTPADGEDINALIIYVVNEDDELELIKGCRYDEATKEIIFHAESFSKLKLAIGYNPVDFEDTDGHWSEANISFLAARGILHGKAAGAFQPDDSITRAEFVTILGNKLGADFGKYGSAPFDDVDQSEWFAGSVSWAQENEIVTGDLGMFRPNDRISRQEMAVILDRYMTRFESLGTTSSGSSATFSDDSEIASYAKASVEKMKQLGIINGKTETTFAPSDSATRAEAAKMITVLMKKSI